MKSIPDNGFSFWIFCMFHDICNLYYSERNYFMSKKESVWKKIILWMTWIILLLMFCLDIRMVSQKVKRGQPLEPMDILLIIVLAIILIGFVNWGRRVIHKQSEKDRKINDV